MNFVVNYVPVQDRSIDLLPCSPALEQCVTAAPHIWFNLYVEDTTLDISFWLAVLVCILYDASDLNIRILLKISLLPNI